MNEKKEKEEKVDSKLSEWLKKAASLSVGAAFVTEDVVKNMVQDLPLPKDVIQRLVEQIQAQKNEFISSVKSEFKSYLSNINPTGEIDKILSKYEINVDAKLSFQRKDQPKKKKQGRS